MKRTSIQRRTPLRAAKPERWYCPVCGAERQTDRCERCETPRLAPILTGRPVAKPKRPRDPIPAHTRAALAEESGGICQRCGAARATDAHHIQARRGGDHSLDNLAHLCRLCHSEVHAHPTQAFADGWIRPHFGGAL